jgi:hypothetical protein
MLDTITIPASTIVPCDDRCMFAKHEDCDCACQGANHQRGGSLTALQREIPRTRVGRRIPILTPGTSDWNLAETLLEQRDEGVTQRDLAAMYGVSAPTVRRLIKSLLFTLALAEKQEEAAQAA